MIPEIIQAKGDVSLYHTADEVEYGQKLKEKLTEEAEEFNDAETIEEFADLLEVMEAIQKHFKFDPEEIKRVKEKKSKERGKFEKRIILDES
jgi:predicted house-cleaning noncanonical NTP pyrophosphatase (MazG superfamily)